VTRWLATLAIALLFALNAALPYTALGRRGNEATVRAHVEAAARLVGQPLPALELEDGAGRAVRLGDLLGRPVLLVFERSVDW
jgi:cytochrome oxidase Cu insertion factor (SCO1/SenC/PrrC family)